MNTATTVLCCQPLTFHVNFEDCIILEIEIINDRQWNAKLGDYDVSKYGADN